jgi:endonuclease/exonuclease/phosphatase (EEP) superfamily protein YafD
LVDEKYPEYSVVGGIDTAILAKGKLELTEPKTVQLAGALWICRGKQVHVFSVRLTPPNLRLDLWNPSAWADYREEKRMRTMEVRQNAGRARNMSKGSPIVFAGDMNAPPDDETFAGCNEWTDAFEAAGVGFGATATSDFPIVRVDSIWVSKEFDVLECRAVSTETSDHRMVESIVRLR